MRTMFWQSTKGFSLPDGERVEIHEIMGDHARIIVRYEGEEPGSLVVPMSELSRPLDYMTKEENGLFYAYTPAGGFLGFGMSPEEAEELHRLDFYEDHRPMPRTVPMVSVKREPRRPHVPYVETMVYAFDAAGELVDAFSAEVGPRCHFVGSLEIVAALGDMNPTAARFEIVNRR